MARKTLDEHIAITPGILGGKPRIAGHRISVEDIAVWHNKMGRAVEEIADTYNLSLSDVYAALAYYHDHREEIDKSIDDGEKLVAEMKKEIPSKLNRELLDKINEVYADEPDEAEKQFLKAARKNHRRLVEGTW